MIRSGGKDYDSWEEFFDDLERNKGYMWKWIDKKFPKGLFGYSMYYMITHPWKIVVGIWMEIIYAKQRIIRGYDDRAIWAIDWYLAKLIPDMVRELRTKQSGIPVEFFSDEDFDENGRCSEEAEMIALEKYFEVLDKIIDGFDSYMAIQEHNLYSGSDGYEEYNKKYEEGFELMRKYFHTLSW